MGMTTIQGHLLPGLAVIIVALLAILHEGGFAKAAWLKYVLPVALVLLGLQGIFDKLMHGAAAPKDYATETAQHMTQGAIILMAGIAEVLRARGVTARRSVAMVFPIALLLVGVMFILHAQQGSGAPMLVMLVQHRAYGLTLIMAAAARAITVLAPERGAYFKLVSPSMLLLFGLEFAIYAEAAGGMGGMQH